MIRKMIEKLKKQNWTFTLIGTDNLDVETMAHSFAIDEHLEFQQDEAGTKAMFARERRSRERYNCCVAEDAASMKNHDFLLVLSASVYPQERTENVFQK